MPTSHFKRYCWTDSLLQVVVALLLVGHVLSNTTVPPGCEFEGKFYRPGEEISRGQTGDWCYGSSCSPTGEIVRWDDFNCNTAETSTVPSQSGCEVDGRRYSPGETIRQGQTGNWCYGSYCDLNGDVINWDDFNCETTPGSTTPPSTTSRISKTTTLQAPTVTQTTTVTPTGPSQTTVAMPPTTQPAPDVCVFEGRTYSPGDVIRRDARGCGYECGENGQLLAYPCQPPTTTPPTTPPAPRGCNYNGQFFSPGNVIQQDPFGCGVFCSEDGDILFATCTRPTTTPPLITTPRGCSFRGRFYFPGQPIDTGASGCGGFCSSGGHIVLATCTTPRTTFPTTTFPTTTRRLGCIYYGKFYPPNRAIERNAFGCGGFCSSTGQLLLATCIPTTRIVTTPPLACFYNGKYYPPNQVIEPDAFGCGAFCSESGEVFAATCGPNPITTTSTTTSTPSPSTTSPPTTTPPGCLYEGKLYKVGERFGEGQQGSWCYGNICDEAGQIIAWDNFNCDTSTSPETTRTTSHKTSTTSPPGCLYEGKLYKVGERFGEGQQGSWCYGNICDETGQIIAWDNFNCDPTTTSSPGITFTPSSPSSRQPTTAATSTSSPNTQQGCLYNGKRYQVGEEISRQKSLNMCYGTLCDANGDVIAWEDFTCGNSTDVGPTREPARDCIYQGRTYRPGQKILLADSRGCKVYCSLAGRVRIERFPCLAPVTNPQRDSTVNVVKRTPIPCVRPEDVDPNGQVSNICLNGAPGTLLPSLILSTLVCLCTLLFISS